MNMCGSSADCPYSVRVGLFGFSAGRVNWNFTNPGHPYFGGLPQACGAAYQDTTFRPVFYAK